MSREQEKKSAFGSNSMGKRLRFVRKNLGLTIEDITKKVGIPRATYGDMENGARSKYYEEIERLCSYLNTRWQSVYEAGKPVYENQSVNQITLQWVMIGTDPSVDAMKKLKDQQKQFFKREFNLINKINQLKES